MRIIDWAAGRIRIIDQERLPWEACNSKSYASDYWHGVEVTVR